LSLAFPVSPLIREKQPSSVQLWLGNLQQDKQGYNRAVTKAAELPPEPKVRAPVLDPTWESIVGRFHFATQLFAKETK